jgi:hypothetical protein
MAKVGELDGSRRMILVGELLLRRRRGELRKPSRRPRGLHPLARARGLGEFSRPPLLQYGILVLLTACPCSCPVVTGASLDFPIPSVLRGVRALTRAWSRCLREPLQ